MRWYILLQKYNLSQVSLHAGQIMDPTTESAEDTQNPLNGKTKSF